MKTLAVATLLVALSITNVSAQVNVNTSSPQSTAFGTDPIIRITSTFRTGITVTEPQAVPDANAQETARRALYKMAENECAALSEIFNAECRLGSVSMLLLVPAASIPPNTMSATASYELRPGRSAAGR
jgi:hypothetical protein